MSAPPKASSRTCDARQPLTHFRPSQSPEILHHDLTSTNTHDSRAPARKNLLQWPANRGLISPRSAAPLGFLVFPGRGPALHSKTSVRHTNTRAAESPFMAAVTDRAGARRRLDERQHDLQQTQRTLNQRVCRNAGCDFSGDLWSIHLALGRRRGRSRRRSYAG